MKIKTIGLIGTIAGSVLGVTGLGLIIGGGLSTYTVKFSEVPSSKAVIDNLPPKTPSEVKNALERILDTEFSLPIGAFNFKDMESYVSFYKDISNKTKKEVVDLIKSSAQNLPQDQQPQIGENITKFENFIDKIQTEIEKYFIGKDAREITDAADYWDSFYSDAKYYRYSYKKTIITNKQEIARLEEINKTLTKPEDQQQLEENKATIASLQNENDVVIPFEQKINDKMIAAGDMVIAGAALFSVFSILAVCSGVLWFLKRKDGSSAKASS